jgi:hypothetical protein
MVGVPARRAASDLGAVGQARPLVHRRRSGRLRRGRRLGRGPPAGRGALRAGRSGAADRRAHPGLLRGPKAGERTISAVSAPRRRPGA